MRRFLASGTAALLLLLTACAGFPTTGNVNPGRDPLDIEDEPGVAFVPDGPQPGASPDQIVDGFLRAGSGPQAEWATARQFLTDDLAETWRPRASVTIDRLADRSTFVTAEGEGTASVTAGVSATGVVDAAGAYSPQPDTVSDLDFDVVQNGDGEWRISVAPDGIVLFEEQFRTVFRSASLSYFDRSGRYLVPDVRWFPAQSAAEVATRALLTDPPSPWLAAAVVSNFPEGIRARGVPVTVSNGVAQVELTDEALSLGSDTLSRMQAQLDATFRSIDIPTVRMTVEGSPLQVTATPTRATRVDTRSLVLTADGVFGFFDDDAVEPVGDLSAAIEAVGTVSSVETAPDRDLAAALTPTGVVRAADDGTWIALDTRAGLIAPTIDTTGTVWTVPAGQPAAVRAHPVDGATVAIPDAWPDARGIRAMQVSRDGTRIAAIVSTGGRDELQVAGIRRGEQTQDLELGEPSVLAAVAGEGLELAWLDETTVGVLERVGDEARMREQPVGGPGTDLTVPAGVVGIVGGNSNARLLTGDGVVYARQTTNWRQIATGVRVLATQQGSP